MAPAKHTDDPAFARNRKALHNYKILETHEAGIELKGTEIKSIRKHQASLDGSFARIEEGEVFLYNMHISPYEQGNRYNVEPLRTRKLLLHRREIERLRGVMTQKRLTLVPLKLYEKHGMAKIELALGRGRREYEKRDRIRKEESDRDLRQMVRQRQREHE